MISLAEGVIRKAMIGGVQVDAMRMHVDAPESHVVARRLYLNWSMDMSGARHAVRASGLAVASRRLDFDTSGRFC